jgi:hypothetical protein
MISYGKWYNSLTQNKTCILVNPLPKKSTIKTKWLFYQKYKSDESLAHYKRWLVTHDFIPQKGVNYVETFSPMLKMTSLWILFSFATLYDYHIH